jgi:hypothetical protein
VDWYIVSFAIGVGEKPQPKSIKWDEFKTLLPGKAPSGQSDDRAAAVAVPGPTAPTATQAYVTVSATSGLLRSSVVAGASHWLVRAGDFAFSADCTFPPSAITIPATRHPDQTVKQPLAVAMRPVGMEAAAYSAPATVTVMALGDDPGPAAVAWAVTPDVHGVPQALWGDPVAGSSPPLNADDPTLTAVVGATLAVPQAVPTAGTPVMAIDTVFGDRTVNENHTHTLPIAPSDAAVGTPPGPADSFADIQNVASDAVKQSRASLFAALRGLGVEPWYDEPLAAVGASPRASFADEPMEGAPA